MSTPERRKPYPFDTIEPRWQRVWEERQTFHVPNPGEPGFNPSWPKYYVLDMFPYPSGSGLHVGHPEGYTATDILGRYKKMRGFNVLHPMGGTRSASPAEQHAIKTGQHPSLETAKNIATFRVSSSASASATTGSGGGQYHRPRLLPLDAVDLSPALPLVV